MREITPETATDYLRETGRVPEGREVTVQALGGGVSNVVMRVDVEGQAPFVLKQARERLRTEAYWISQLDRIWTEKAALEWLATFLPVGTVPEVLFADPENFLLAMTCAPLDATVWKGRLLAGEVDPAVARRAGEVLGAIHAETSGHPDLKGHWADLVVFDQLRIDPFYRTIARVHPDVSPQVEALLARMRDMPRACLVLADFSPKNILVHARGLTVVDFETAHAGDPAFDLGFFLSHLLLKAVRARPDHEPYLALTRSFQDAYLGRFDAGEEDIAFGRRVNAHAAACALARVDGTSPVDYLDPRARETVRRFARTALQVGPPTWDALLGLLAREMRYKDHQISG